MLRKKLSDAEFDGECESAVGLAKFEAEEVEAKNRMWCYQMLGCTVLEERRTKLGEPKLDGKLSS